MGKKLILSATSGGQFGIKKTLEIVKKGLSVNR